MVFTFSNNPIDILNIKLINLHEKYTHWVWNKKHHNVRCVICGDVLDSKSHPYSPEESGWKCVDKYTWICHSCLYHRDFMPYIKLVDIDEDICYFKDSPKLQKELQKVRRAMIRKIKKGV